MEAFDFTTQGRRPTTAQIIAAWKRAGKPDHFCVEYGETFAEFQRAGWREGRWPAPATPRWIDSGNGCRGVNRTAVVAALERAV